MTPLLFALVIATAPPSQCGVASAEKEAFLGMLTQLPTKGEFFTDDAVTKAVPQTRVLLALTEKDIKGRDIYPFLALSSGLSQRKEPCEYGVKHFNEISHPTIKVFWAVLLFDKNSASPDIVAFLQSALKSEEQSRFLEEALGPSFTDFKRRVNGFNLKPKCK